MDEEDRKAMGNVIAVMVIVGICIGLGWFLGFKPKDGEGKLYEHEVRCVNLCRSAGYAPRFSFDPVNRTSRCECLRLSPEPKGGSL
jgi:hypothetical protein